MSRVYLAIVKVTYFTAISSQDPKSSNQTETLTHSAAAIL